MRAARRRSIMLPLSSDWTLAPPRVGLVDAFALAGGGGGGRVGDEGVGGVGVAAGDVGFVVGAGAEGLVGVDAGDAEAAGEVDELADVAGVGVGFVDGVGVGRRGRCG